MRNFVTELNGRSPEEEHGQGGHACGCSPAVRFVCRCEPYRVLFPLGVIIGMIGVMLWPAFVYGWLPAYPAVAHARIMVEGFVFCFMTGFLASAIPHMLEVKPISFVQTLLLAAFLLTVTLLHALGKTLLGDVAFVVLVVSLLGLVLRRWRQRKDLPPPGLALACLGVVSGAFGASMMVLYAWVSMPGWVYALGRLLLYHGLILFPVLGAGVYLLPRMVGLPNRHLIQPKSPSPSPAWRKRAGFMFLCGMVLLASFVIEVMGKQQVAYVVRVLAILVCLFHEVPLHQVRKIPGTIPKALVVAFACILLGYALPAIWPEQYMTYIHIAFISGFGLLVLNIGARVMLGHSGQTDFIYRKSNPMRWVLALTLLTMSTRVSANLIPSMMWSHYAYAAFAWVVTLLIWLSALGPLVVVFPNEQDGS